MLKQPEIRTIPISDGDVRVAVYGSGDPILFLHGVSAHGRSWETVASRFSSTSSGWACWIPDLIGRGGSSADPHLSYRVDSEVGRLAELIAALREQTSAPPLQIVVGHSHGAGLAVAFAARETSVRGLLLSSPVTADIARPRALDALRSPGVRRAVAAAFAPLHMPLGRLVLKRAGGPHYRMPDDAIRSYAEPYGDRRRARTLMKILADWDPAELEARTPQRTLEARVYTGAHDPRVPVGAAQRLAERLRCSLDVVEEGGHVLPEQTPDLLAEGLRSVAESVRASRS